MKCCSRSTLGVVIGSLNIFIYIIASIVFISVAGRLNDQSDPLHEEISEKYEKAAEMGTILICSILSACLVMIVISGVLIIGIIKRRHKLMLPWLVLTGIGFVCNCARVIITVIIGLVTGISFSYLLLNFVLNALGCGIEALILWPIYTLWRDIRIKNEEKSERIMAGGMHYESDPPPEYNYYSTLPQKS